MIGLRVEHGLSVPDRLLELLEPQPNVSPETQVGGLIAVEKDGPVYSGKSFGKSALHAIRMGEPVLEVWFVGVLLGSFTSSRNRRPGVARLH